ncbi:hypothetical protein V3595_22070 [Bacillus sp. CFBP9009]
MLKIIIEELMRKVNKRSVETLDRDIQIVQTYFGLRTQVYPTYQSIADEYGVGSRQTVQQIISKRFVNRVEKEDFMVIHNISQIIEQKEIRYVEEFIQQLNQGGFINGEVHIKGLFNLLQTFGYCLDYKLYNLNIERATEIDFVNMTKLLFIKDDKQEDVLEHVRTIKTLPGRHGMVNFFELISKNSWLKDQDIPLYQSLIQNSKTAKVFFELGTNNMWYMYEDRSNAIVNALGKIVNVTNQVKSDILAETIHSDISKRTFQKSIPSVDIIKQYISNSNFIDIDGEFAKINIEKRKLQEIETDICNYFKNKSNYTASYSEINVYLEMKGHSRAYRKKKLFSCPFVYVDKSQGRGNYQLKLINQFSPQFVGQENENTYEKYRNLLRQLQGKTDITRGFKQRTEQSLLKEWLFKNKETEKCAICGRTFSCRSLVTAHKKKRANCTEEERTDPYIVMPVCLFGCDYLYENGFIRINSGQIHIQNTDALQDAEREYLQALENTVMDHRWLQGSKNYFAKTTGNGTSLGCFPFV